MSTSVSWGMVISAKAHTLRGIISKQLGYYACIGGEKRLDSVQPGNCMGNGSAMLASVLSSLTGKGGNDGNLHREEDFRIHTSVQRWTDDFP